MKNKYKNQINFYRILQKTLKTIPTFAYSKTVDC